MTDDEIRQSRIDHWHQREEIRRIVCINTPSRLGVTVRPNGTRYFHDYSDWYEPRRG